MRRCAVLGAALPMLAGAAAAQPPRPEGVRAALARIFEVAPEQAGALRVEVEAIENGPDAARGRLPELESELGGLFAAHGLPPAQEPDDPDAIAVTCRVGQTRAAEDDSGWTHYRWDGSCDISRRGRMGPVAVRAGGESHPDAATARQRSRDAALRAMVEALDRRLTALADED